MSLHTLPVIAWPSVEQAAALLQVSTKTIRRYIANGTIDARRVGPRLIRINPESINNIGTPLKYTGGESE